jgi:hypothetical protein
VFTIVLKAMHARTVDVAHVIVSSMLLQPLIAFCTPRRAFALLAFMIWMLLQQPPASEADRMQQQTECTCQVPMQTALPPC